MVDGDARIAFVIYDPIPAREQEGGAFHGYSGHFIELCVQPGAQFQAREIGRAHV